MRTLTASLDALELETKRAAARFSQSADALAQLAKERDQAWERADWVERAYQRKTRIPRMLRRGLHPLGWWLDALAKEGLRPREMADRLRDMHLIAGSDLFDTSFYLDRNWDVRAVGRDPVAHFALTGWREGRDPSAKFSTSGYLRAHADVAAAGVNPLVHYIMHGRTEGRAPALP